MLDEAGHSGEARTRLEGRLARPSVWSTFLHFLERRGHAIPPSVLEAPDTAPTAADDAVQEALVGVYRGDPEAAELCERLIDLDEGLQEWRYRHVKMVERTIGNSRGTGGSSGAGYLKSTLFSPVFPELWAIRSRF